MKRKVFEWNDNSVPRPDNWVWCMWFKDEEDNSPDDELKKTTDTIDCLWWDGKNLKRSPSDGYIGFSDPDQWMYARFDDKGRNMIDDIAFPGENIGTGIPYAIMFQFLYRTAFGNGELSELWNAISSSIVTLGMLFPDPTGYIRQMGKDIIKLSKTKYVQEMADERIKARKTQTK